MSAANVGAVALHLHPAFITSSVAASEMSHVQNSLSVFQLVQDCGGTLDIAVRELLEIIPDLTHHFEIVLLDQGATEETAESAREWVRNYPQVRLVMFGPGLSLTSVLRRALNQTGGDLILLRDEHCCADLNEVRKLWQLKDEYAAILGSVGTASVVPPPRGLKRLLTWNRTAMDAAPPLPSTPLQLIHRSTAQRLWVGNLDPYEAAANLSKQGYRWCELTLRRSSTLLRRPGAMPLSGAMAGGRMPQSVFPRPKHAERFSRVTLD